MKTLLIFLVSFALIGGIAFADSLRSSNDVDIMRLLDDSGIANRLKGFRLARKIDSEKVNNKLVALLDSHDEGGKVNSLLLLPSWHEALIILAERFPEAGITKKPILYKRDDVIKFKSWWHENSAKIEYYNNTHSFSSKTVSDVKGMERNQPHSLPKETNETTQPPLAVATPQTTPIPSAAMPVDPHKSTLAMTPASSAKGTNRAPSSFLIVVVTFVAAVLSGIAVFFHRHKK